MAIKVPISDESVPLEINPEQKERPVLFLPDQDEAEAGQLEENYWEVIKENPDRAAQILRLARNYGQHPVDVAEDPEGSKLALEAPKREDWKTFHKNYPNTAKWLRDPKNMATANDLFPELQAHENMFTRVKRGFQSGQLNVEQSELGWQQLMDTLTTGKLSSRGEDRLWEIEAQMGGIDRPSGFAPSYFVGEQMPNYLFMAEKGLERGLPMAGAFGLGALALGQAGPQVLVPEEVVTVPAAALIGLKVGGSIGVAEAGAILEGGSAFREFTKIKDKDGNPIYPQLAAQAALAVGIINAGLEYASARLLLRTIPGGEKILDFMAKEEIKGLVKKQTSKSILIEGVKRYLQNIVGEVGQEIAQEAVTSGMGKALEGKPFNLETIGEVASEAAQVISPTIQSTGVFGLPGLGGYTVSGLRRVSQAKVDAEAYRAIGEGVADSKYLERYPEGFRELAGLNTQGGRIENIYVDTEQFTTLCQSLAPEGVDPAGVPLQVAEELGVGDQYQAALETGQPLVFSYAEWLSKVVKTPLYKGLEQHISFSEDGLTLAQAAMEEETINRRIAEEQRQAEELIQRNEELKQGQEFVYNDIKDRLLSVGRPENISKREWPAYVDRAARIWAARAATEAAKRDITVEEWYQGANRPGIVKAEFMPADVGPEIREKLDGREREFLDVLTERNQSIESVEQEVEAEYNRILQGQIDYLSQSGGKGVQQGSLVTDQDGNVVDRIGRQSNNPLWYRDFYTEKGRAPSKRELRELAIRQLQEGYKEDTMEVPTNLDFVSLENTLQGIRNLRSKIAATKGGASYNQEDYHNIPEIIAAQKAQQEYLDKNGPTININTPERRILREKIANDLYAAGAKNKEKKAAIVLGLPASGKSKAAAEPLAQETGSLIVDSDLAKEGLPEYNNGKLAGAVHAESDLIWSKILDKAIRNNDNIVLPLVGRNIEKIRVLRDRLSALGYTIDLRYVDLPVEKAIDRAITRFFGTGRFVDPAYVKSIGLQPRQNYDILKLEKGWASYEGYSNDVAKGEPPILLESSVAGREKTTGPRDRSLGQNTGGTGNPNSQIEKIEPNRSGNQGDSYFQSDVIAPEFYSKLERFIEGQKQETFSADQLRGMLGKTGIKDDELKWTGVMAWLEGKKKVTRQEVLEYLRTDGQVKVEVKTLEKKSTVNDGYSNPLTEAEIQELESLGSRLESGETLTPEDQGRFDVLNEKAYQMDIEDEQHGIIIQDNTKYSKYTVSGGENYKEILLTLPTSEKPEVTHYVSSHWNTPNVLAHIRTTERVDANGNKVLFIEELQSDWGQEGKKKGFSGTIDTAGWYTEKGVPEDGIEVWSVFDSKGELQGTAKGTSKQAIQEIANHNTILSAPFVTSTDKWLNLSLKHIIRYAAENGFDKIAWATGEQNAGHYDLTKQIEKIQYWAMPNGTYGFSAYRIGNDRGPDIKENNLSPEEVESFLGKEIAQKIVNRENPTDKVGETQYGELTGLDLKVGGEGMKAFYDKIVPQTVQKFIRQFDKDAKLETLDIGQGLQQGFSIPDKLRDVALYEGFSLFQDEADRRAMVNITPEKSLVTLFARADASSFLHESAHLFLDDMFRFVRSGQAGEAYLKDWETLSQWLEIKDGQEALTVEQQEKFARGFERYLMEGKSPSEGLRKAFSALRKWLVRIYRDVAGLGVEISDEVRGVMDRMLATEEEIREREAINGYLMAVIDQKDVTPETWERLNELRERAHELAVQTMLKPQLEKTKPEYQEFLAQERERIREIVEGEVEELPVYKVMEAVRMAFGQQKNIKELAQRYLDKAEGITDEGVAKFENIADIYGYSSGDHLARTIIAAPHFVDEVNNRVEVHMAQYNELSDSVNLKLEAEQAVRNEYQLEGLALEKAILLELVTASDKKELGKQYRRQHNIEKARIEAAAARRYAREVLADKPIRTTTAYGAYVTAERNAAVKQAQALAKKDFEAAVKYGAQKLLNHALAMEALRNKTEIDKAFKYLEKFQRKKRPEIAQEHLNQIDKILDRFGLIKMSPNAAGDATSLGDWIKSREDYDDAAIPPFIKNEYVRMSYKKLTLGQLRDLVDAVKNIETVARNENRFLTDEKKRQKEEVVKDVVKTIKGNNPALFPGDLDPNPQKFEKALGMFRGFIASHQKVEWIVRALDGYKDQGPCWRYIILPLLRAMDKEYTLRREAGEKLTGLYRKHYGDDVSQLATRKYHVEPVAHIFPRGLTKENILAMALNWGNEVNQKRLVDSYLKTEEMDAEEAWAIIDRYRRSPEGKKEGLSNYEIILREKERRIKQEIETVLAFRMEKRDWDFVQETWDLINSYWPMIVEVERARRGVEPFKVEAKSVETPYGEYRGGYYPIVYDPTKSEIAGRHEEQSNLKGLTTEITYLHPAVKKGFTKERGEPVHERPLSLQLSVADKHLTDVIHMTSYINALRDVDMILNDKQVMAAIKETMGDEVYKQFRPWLQGIARDYAQPMAPVEKLLNKARMGATVVNMGWKFTTAFSQLAGIIPAMEKIGPVRAMAAMMDFHSKFITGKAQEEIDFVFGKSEMMRNRSNNFDRDIRDASKRLIQQGKFDGVTHTYFTMAGLFDYAVSIPVWIEAYNQQIAQQLKSGQQINEEMAIRYADGVIRETQGSGDIINMAQVQRGGAWNKLMTMFYSYFSVVANKEIEAVQRATRRREHAPLVSFAIYWWFFPAIISEFLAGRGPDPEEDDGLLKWLMATVLKYPASGFVLVRDVVNKLGSSFGGFELTPAAEAFSPIIGIWNSTVQKAIEDEEIDWGKAGKHAFELSGYWAKYPARQMEITAGNIYEAMTGEEFELRDLFFPKPESRR